MASERVVKLGRIRGSTRPCSLDPLSSRFWHPPRPRLEMSAEEMRRQRGWNKSEGDGEDGVDFRAKGPRVACPHSVGAARGGCSEVRETRGQIALGSAFGDGTAAKPQFSDSSTPTTTHNAAATGIIHRRLSGMIGLGLSSRQIVPDDEIESDSGLEQRESSNHILTQQSAVIATGRAQPL